MSTHRMTAMRSLATFPVTRTRQYALVPAVAAAMILLGVLILLNGAAVILRKIFERRW